MDVQLSSPTNCRTNAHFIPVQTRDSIVTSFCHAIHMSSAFHGYNLCIGLQPDPHQSSRGGRRQTSAMHDNITFNIADRRNGGIQGCPAKGKN